VTRRLAPAASLAASFLLLLAPVARAAAGDLDPSWGGAGAFSDPAGIATTDLSGGVDSPEAMVLDGDQPIVVGTTSASATAWFVAKFSATTGYLDTSFNTDGMGSIDPGVSSFPTAVAMDSLGRIVVVGEASLGGSDHAFEIARFTSDGDPDAGFGGGDGLVQVNPGTGDDEAAAVAIDSQDRIVVAGWTTAATGGTKFEIVRLTTAGDLDTSFSSDGMVASRFSANDAAHAVTVDASDKVVAAGWGMNGQRWDVARYKTSGALDTRFSSDGFQEFRMGSSQLDATGVAIDSNGRILVGGYGESSGIRSECAAVRFTPRGGFDSTFSGDGIAFVITNQTATCAALALGGNDKPVMAGAIQPGTGGSSADDYVVRLTSKGKRDNNFGSSGEVRISDSTVFDRASGVGIQSGGRIVVEGETQAGLGNGLTNVLLAGLLGS